MMMDAVLAIALGIVPVEDSGSAVTVRVRSAQLVTRYSQTVDRVGRTHLRGIHPRTGQRYHVIVSRSGEVEGRIGNRSVVFQASPAS
mgnify:CR=1 FL=1